jgi:hypothetical protein
MAFFLMASALAGAILGGTRYEDEHATAALSFLALFAGWPFSTPSPRAGRARRFPRPTRACWRASFAPT